MRNKSASSERDRPRATDSDGRGTEGVVGRVFVFAADGLRCAGAGSGERAGFLGYAAEEIFWRDVLEFVHEDDLEVIWPSLFRIMELPGASECVRIRLRDARGGWRPVEAAVQNVLEVPDDGGLIVVNMCPIAG